MSTHPLLRVTTSALPNGNCIILCVPKEPKTVGYYVILASDSVMVNTGTPLRHTTGTNIFTQVLTDGTIRIFHGLWSRNGFGYSTITPAVTLINGTTSISKYGSGEISGHTDPDGTTTIAYPHHCCTEVGYVTSR